MNFKILLCICAKFWRILQGQIPVDSEVETEYNQIEQEGLKLIESKTSEEATPYILGMMVATGFDKVKERPFWDELPADLKKELDEKFPNALRESRVAYQKYLSPPCDQKTPYQKKKDLLRDQPKKIIILLKIYAAFLKSIKNFIKDKVRVNSSVVGVCIQKQKEDYKSLSLVIRKLKFPFLSGIKCFDEHNTWYAKQKLDRIYETISPEIMEQLTDLDTPFPFESKLPAKPVVAILQLKKVTKRTLHYELNLLDRNILNALFALLTKTGITLFHTECDNQRYEGCFEGLCGRVKQMMSGEIPSNQKTHWDAQHCRDHHGCPSCRALCAMMTILRYPSNPDIGKQISRCIWHESIFAELAICHFLLLKLGPTCALAQVVNSSESPHRLMLIQLLTEMIVQETTQEKRLRKQQDAADRQIELAALRDHVHMEWHLNEDERRNQDFIFGLRGNV